MKRTTFPAMMIVAVLLAIFGRMALSQQDKYTVQTQNGLAFSEFRGYEDWQVVARFKKGESTCHTMPQVPTSGFRAGMPD